MRYSLLLGEVVNLITNPNGLSSKDKHPKGGILSESSSLASYPSTSRYMCIKSDGSVRLEYSWTNHWIRARCDLSVCTPWLLHLDACHVNEAINSLATIMLKQQYPLH